MLQKTDQYDFTSVLYLFESVGYLAYWLLKDKSNEASILEGDVYQFFISTVNKKSDLMNFCLQIFAIYISIGDKMNPKYLNLY